MRPAGWLLIRSSRLIAEFDQPQVSEWLSEKDGAPVLSQASSASSRQMGQPTTWIGSSPTCSKIGDDTTFTKF